MRPLRHFWHVVHPYLIVLGFMAAVVYSIIADDAGWWPF